VQFFQSNDIHALLFDDLIIDYDILLNADHTNRGTESEGVIQPTTGYAKID
jgi:hypothetical protein